MLRLLTSTRDLLSACSKEKKMSRLPNLRRIVPVLAAIALISVPALAQKYTAPSMPQIGSANTVTADPVVPRPAGQPCTVQLFSNFDFADFNPKFFSYSPDCAGPWAKVVLNADWSVDAGRQFDRTAEIWIGGTQRLFRHHGGAIEDRGALMAHGS